MRRQLNILTILAALLIVPIIGIAIFNRFSQETILGINVQYLHIVILGLGWFILIKGLDLWNRVNIYQKLQKLNRDEVDKFFVEQFAHERMVFIKGVLLLTLFIAFAVGGLIIAKIWQFKKDDVEDILLFLISLGAILLILNLTFLYVAIKNFKGGQTVIFGSNVIVVKKHIKKKSWINELLQIKSIDTDQESDLRHDFDGISELDNPAPPWFMYLFYSCILFSVVYMIRYSWLKTGPDQKQEYDQAVLVLEARTQSYLAKQADNVDERTVKYIQDKNKLMEAQSIFKQKCATCHGQNAEGATGPNLTDEYWLHGNTINQIFSTIKYGVSGKAMIPWKDQLPSSKIAALASYILSIQGSKPANASKPEGIKLEPVIIK